MPSYIADDHTPIAYLDTGGDKPPIIFIHGWTSAAADWRGTMLALRRHYRCIAIDLRAHGKTPFQGDLTIRRLARDVHGLIEHLDLRQPSIVGWSMGGLATFEYVRQFGTRHLNTITLVDQTPRIRTDDEWSMGLFGAYTDEHLTVLHDLFATDARRVVRRFALGIVHPDRRVLRFVSWLAAPYRVHTKPEALMALAADMAQHDYRSLLADINVPVLLCYGGASWLYPGKVGEYLRDHLADATLVRFERSGHCPPIEEPRKFARTVRTFLNAHPRPVSRGPGYATRYEGLGTGG